jgi:hypothetical protein
MIAGNEISVPMDYLRSLKTGESYKLQRIPPYPALPIAIYLKDGVVCADVTMSGGAWDIEQGRPGVDDIKIDCGKFRVENPAYDKNWSKNALEIVRDNKVSIFQMIYKNSNTIEINGIFLIGHDQALFVSPDEPPIVVKTTDPNFQTYGLNPIFKYPSWQFQGQLR